MNGVQGVTHLYLSNSLKKNGRIPSIPSMNVRVVPIMRSDFNERLVFCPRSSYRTYPIGSCRSMLLYQCITSRSKGERTMNFIEFFFWLYIVLGIVGLWCEEWEREQ